MMSINIWYDIYRIHNNIASGIDIYDLLKYYMLIFFCTKAYKYRLNKWK